MIQELYQFLGKNLQGKSVLEIGSDLVFSNHDVKSYAIVEPDLAKVKKLSSWIKKQIPAIQASLGQDGS